MKYKQIIKQYAGGYMAVFEHYNSDQPPIREDIAFFADRVDAERFLAESGFTRETRQYWPEWRGNGYVNASIDLREIFKF